MTLNSVAYGAPMKAIFGREGGGGTSGTFFPVYGTRTYGPLGEAAIQLGSMGSLYREYISSRKVTSTIRGHQNTIRRVSSLLLPRLQDDTFPLVVHVSRKL